MKHLTRITKAQPVHADAVQDFICFSAQSINAFISIIGGLLPFTTFIEEKCAFPTPDGAGTGTET